MSGKPVPQPANPWQKAQTIATWVQVIIVIVSVYLIRSQLNQQKLYLAHQVNLSRAANTQALVNLITPLNLKVTDHAMAELWVKGDEGIDKVPDATEREIQREQYHSLIVSNLVFYENVYTQFREGLLDKDIYEGWDKDLAAFIKTHKIAKHWNEWKDAYRKDFSNRIDQIIAAQQLTSTKDSTPR